MVDNGEEGRAIPEQHLDIPQQYVTVLVVEPETSLRDWFEFGMKVGFVTALWPW